MKSEFTYEVDIYLKDNSRKCDMMKIKQLSQKENLISFLLVHFKNLGYIWFLT
jgi:hypothetical protein